MGKIAIITRKQNSSPRVLAENLELLIKKCQGDPVLFYKIRVIKRLLKYKETRGKYKRIFWIFFKIFFWLSDSIFIKKLKSFDAIIISDCSPLGFMKNEYAVERLHTKMGEIPILFYEVYFLGNAPTQIEMLKKNADATIERYNWHLAVTDVTEIRNKPQSPWSHIGLYLKGFGLAPSVKKEILAIVDFAQPGFESFREKQVQVLKELRIPYISLEKRYSITEIREIYKKGTFYFMQSYEAFGLPIAECLCYGDYIFTPDSSWPMAWRLNEKPEVHGEGILPECFVVYKDEKDLKNRLKKIIEEYDLIETPKKVFQNFMKHYPFLYTGNQAEMKNILRKIQSKELHN